MKNFFRTLGIIALALIIVFAFTACPDSPGGSKGGGGGGGGNPKTPPKQDPPPSLTNWQLATNFPFDAYVPITHDGTKFVALRTTSGTTEIATSPTGETWTILSASNNLSEAIRAAMIAGGGGRVIGISGTGPYKLFRSN